jgi:preprotein translocase SecE subunit
VARNRKRARDRRPTRPATPVDPRQGLPTATHDVDNGAADLERDNGAAEIARGEDAGEVEPVDRGSDSLEPVHLVSDSDEDDPLHTDSREDTADDVGPEAFDDHDDGAPAPLEHATPDVELAEEQLAYGRPEEPEPDEAEDEEEFEREVEESIAAGGGGRGGRGGRRGRGYDGGGGAGASGGGELAAPGATAVAERHPSVLARLIGFLQGSWRELQRVQWPDRRQVFQATGVVIGFVIVAAVFLGAADWVSGKLVTFVLK